MRLLLVILILSSIYIQKTFADTIHIYRPWNEVGTWQKVKVSVNGYSQNLKTKGYATFSVNGPFTIELKGGGVGAAFSKKSIFRGNAGSNGNQYFLIDLQEGFVTSKYVVTRTSEEIFKYSFQQSN